MLGAAVQHDSEALRLATAPSARARILLRLAQDYAAQGDSAGARRILDDLIEHPPIDDQLVRAMARVQRARLLGAAGAAIPAEQDLLQGIRGLDRYDALAERFDARVELARMYAQQGRTGEALHVLRRALAFSQEIRAQTANPEYRTSIAESLRPAVSLEVDLLHERFLALKHSGQSAAARAVARQSLAAVDDDRAFGFQAWRSEYLEREADPELARWVAESSALYRDMADRRYQLAVREDRAGAGDKRAAALREDIARLRARLGVLSAEIARRSAQRPGGSDAAVPDNSWHRTQAAVSDDHAVIQYWLGGDRAYAWVVRSSGVDWVELSTSAGISRVARRVAEVMRSPASPVEGRREANAALYRLVFAPLKPALEGTSDLVVIPDEALHYVAFGALRDPSASERAYLVQSFSLAEAPALRFLPELHARRRAWPAMHSRTLIVADPVYTEDDPRLRAAGELGRTRAVQAERGLLPGMPGGPALVRLESSAQEAAQLQNLFGPDGVEMLEGLDATRDAVLARDLKRYRFIHFASHGVVDAEIPQLSALILGTHGADGPVADPYLRAADLLTRTFHAQVVVLSACDTALGKEYGAEGLVGLRYAALARGADAVVASLWPVADGITARLMTGMYRRIIAADRAPPTLEAGNLPVAAALTGAIREELARAPALDPALWAPFTVYVAAD
ncbi:MAG TPA: CHAT domain-containing protein [Candidatus Dormibacteraeota bacterium]|nr:CHAT domain-containing protein [Candidatus Dormibacteraeota bacterium]